MAITKYNSEEVERAAATVRRSAQALSSTAISGIRSIRRELPDNFEGEAANALSQRLYEVDGDILKLQAALNTISRALYKFAEEIRRADREIKSSLGG